MSDYTDIAVTHTDYVTTVEIQRPPAARGEHTDAALADWGFSADDIARLHETEAVA